MMALGKAKTCESSFVWVRRSGRGSRGRDTTAERLSPLSWQVQYTIDVCCYAMIPPCRSENLVVSSSLPSAVPKFKECRRKKDRSGMAWNPFETSTLCAR